MKPDPYKVELADVAKEAKGNVVITFHTAEIRFTCEQLQNLKAKGYHTDIITCVMAGLACSGKSEDEIKAFLEEANKAKGGISLAFEAPDDGALNIKSKEENPLIDQFVQAVENQK